MKHLKLLILGVFLIPSVFAAHAQSMSLSALPPSYASRDVFRQLDSDTRKKIEFTREMFDRNGSIVLCSSPDTFTQALSNLFYNDSIKNGSFKIDQFIQGGANQVCAVIVKTGN